MTTEQMQKLHKESCFNCLTWEQFVKLCDTHPNFETEQYEMYCECEDCETYYLGDHRCSCGNRRCCVGYDEPNKLNNGFFRVEVY